MSEPVFETSYLGTRVKVFLTHVSYKILIGGEKTIPLKQIASVELGMSLFAQVIIETSGGKRYKIPVALGQKDKLRDAIYDVMNK